MKTSFKILSGLLLGSVFMACNSKPNKETSSDSTAYETSTTTGSTEAKVIPGTYKDLNTGKTVYIISDPQTGYAVDSITRVPVEFYIDNSGDTLYQNGLVVNNAVTKADGKWMLDETKVKTNGDKMKIKYENGDKIKVNGSEMKSKDADGKIKVEDDTVKVKTNH
jgi:hypothetical protein